MACTPHPFSIMLLVIKFPGIVWKDIREIYPLSSGWNMIFNYYINSDEGLFHSKLFAQYGGCTKTCNTVQNLKRSSQFWRGTGTEIDHLNDIITKHTSANKSSSMRQVNYLCEDIKRLSNCVCVFAHMHMKFQKYEIFGKRNYQTLLQGSMYYFIISHWI